MSLPEGKALPFFPPVRISLPDHSVSVCPRAEEPSLEYDADI